jgi:Lrp/AsnC family transcriptional regulator, regulator for asnA, asnC and gidA
MTTKLDRIDKQIVDLLTEDGRMSCADIAREVGGITERTVRYRLDRLIAEKVITVSAIVDPKALGYPVVADVFIEVEPGQVQDLAYKLAGYEIVTYVACATGERDISVQIVAKDNQELYRFVTEVIGRIPGVRRTTTSIVPLVIKDDAHWRIPETLFKDVPRSLSH